MMLWLCNENMWYPRLAGCRLLNSMYPLLCTLITYVHEQHFPLSWSTLTTPSSLLLGPPAVLSQRPEVRRPRCRVWSLHRLHCRRPDRILWSGWCRCLRGVRWPAGAAQCQAPRVRCGQPSVRCLCTAVRLLAHQLFNDPGNNLCGLVPVIMFAIAARLVTVCADCMRHSTLAASGWRNTTHSTCSNRSCCAAAPSCVPQPVVANASYTAGSSLAWSASAPNPSYMVRSVVSQAMDAAINVRAGASTPAPAGAPTSAAGVLLDGNVLNEQYGASAIMVTGGGGSKITGNLALSTLMVRPGHVCRSGCGDSVLARSDANQRARRSSDQRLIGTP